MMIAAAVEPEPFATGGLYALLASAAQNCPDVVLVDDDHGPSLARDVARRMRRLAARFRAVGLSPGERVLILAGAQTCALVALAAALRARLEPVLAPCGLGPIDMAAQVRAAGAVALVGPSSYGSLQLGEAYLSTAALSQSVRVIATQGPGLLDGAVDVSFAALDAMPEPPSEAEEPAAVREAPMIGTFGGTPDAPRLMLHRQAVLLADALSLVEQANINPSKRLIVTIPPSSLAGLVAGPFAALIGASSLVWHGPFAASRLLAACDAEPGAHLVVPAALGSLFGQGELSAGFGSLILISRHVDAASFAVPRSIPSDRPVVDLYAFGEEMVLAQRRVEGTARPPIQITDKSLDGGLGAKLNRARAEAVGTPNGERL